MKVNKIIEYACVMLDKEDLMGSPILLGQEDSDEERKKELTLLLKCVNYTMIKLVTHYKPLVSSMTVSTSEPIAMREHTEHIIHNILSVKTLAGASVEYSIQEDKILCPNVGQVVIKYSYYPKEVAFGEDITYYAEDIHEQIVALSVVSDYYFIKGFEEEMNRYDEEFQKAIANIARKKSEIYIKPRRWV